MRTIFRLLLAFASATLLLVAAAAAYVTLAPISLPREQVEFTLAPGSSLRAAAREIAASEVGIEPWVLIALARLLGVESSIKAGSYQISRGTTPLELLRKLTRGDFTQAELTFIEGWTFRQMRERIAAHPDLRHETSALSEDEIMHLLGAPGLAAEGAFFPDTYLFAKRSTDLDLLARAYRAMQQHLHRHWQARAEGLPLRDAYQALILASIVEKETGRDQDRSLVAAVFINRLRLGMPLQTDPTVIYGLGNAFDGDLRKRDLLTDTPYNSYTRRGLPPTPIAMPGLASLQAALHPAASDALYFVARGDGSSQFSRTLAEHNQAVLRHQKGGRP
ncbi:MAG TPA: endolytic transglycosylase MltG [Candidatus Accumulibacter phosphatis]|nr:MAG: putative aminodeoxychorismate lyase [Candidatus Accumulibacter sp. SK-11]HAY28491.1 endolytic transglycosylase MltG [Accumulibacter sp.]HCN69011.1 endolytic transglycosylase MltG [Accumulibacter sp.]HRL77806.1 endolytic transglycosylase MltG [Candidatus Accumulibacter phosphatis]HRQ96384.1 endolytic transglycosylase MltG [Candidatus Accumulibacter phosphatis]